MNRYQTFWPRFWAGVIDGLVLIPLTIADTYLASPERGMFVFILWSVIVNTAYWLYSVVLHTRYGQTLGKMAMGVKVLSVSEDRIPTLRQAFLRDIGYIIPNVYALIYLVSLALRGEYSDETFYASIPGQLLLWASLGWFLLEVISMLTNEKRRALHDFIAKTVVVRSAKQPVGAAAP